MIAHSKKCPNYSKYKTQKAKENNNPVMNTQLPLAIDSSTSVNNPNVNMQWPYPPSLIQWQRELEIVEGVNTPAPSAVLIYNLSATIKCANFLFFRFLRFS